MSGNINERVSAKALSMQDIPYPAQTVHIVPSGELLYLNITGYEDDTPLHTLPPDGKDNEKWRIDYIQEGVFKIVNAATGKLLSPRELNISDNTPVVLMTDRNHDAQLWHFTEVEKDFLGNGIYYNISSYMNDSLVLGRGSNDNGVYLQPGNNSKGYKWKVNCNGLNGFAGNCLSQDKQEKGGTIGGLFGETVFVNDLQSLKNALLETRPLTIILMKNIDNANDEFYDLHIEDFKTIIGSYKANRITDPRLRTDDYFNKEAVSNNIILKNLSFNVAGRDSVEVFAVYGSSNIWVDHCTFKCTLELYYDEVGKFIWVNRSRYAGLDPNYVTLSYNKFHHRFWGIAFGADSAEENCGSTFYNRYESIVQRAPQLGNGKLHVLNSLYERTEASLNNDGYASIKCGAGSQVYSDANRFIGYRKESSGYWDNEVEIANDAAFKDTGSWTNRGEQPTLKPYQFVPPVSPVTNWNPAKNYGYSIVRGYGEKDVAEFVERFSGVVTQYSDLHYIEDEICADYRNTVIDNPIYS